MNLTLKILLLSDAVFALALAIYLFIKYRKIFKESLDAFRMEVAVTSDSEPEVTYEEEKVERNIQKDKE